MHVQKSRSSSAGKAALFFLIIFRSLHQGGIWDYDNIPANIYSHTHTYTEGAIVTLLHHTRGSSGKPREEAEKEV